jgi:hypothetical protein
MSRRSRKNPIPSSVVTELKTLHKTQVSPVELGRHLGLVVSAGYSKRSLAKVLGCSDGTVRRNIRIAALPRDAQEAIEAGESARDHLDFQRSQLEAEHQQRRIQEEKESGLLSAQHGRFIRHWIEEQGIGAGYRSQFFDEVRLRICSVEHWTRTSPGRYPLPQPSSTPANLLLVIEACRPSEAECPLWMGLLATWAARWILRAIPEPLIRNAAIRHAEVS